MNKYWWALIIVVLVLVLVIWLSNYARRANQETAESERIRQKIQDDNERRGRDR